MDLKSFLVWATTAGASFLAYFIVNKITEKGTPSTWSAWTVRVLAYAISGIIATLAFLVLVVMQYQSPPETTRAWIEQIFVVATTAFGLATIIHGEQRLSREVRKLQP